MQQEPLLWDKVEWKQGDGRYRFEVAEGGLHATFVSPHGQKLTVPMVAWYGLLDALAAARKTKDRSDRPMPVRYGARWSAAEIDDLVSGFHSGTSIAALSRAHNRSELAVESQLAQRGLWDRVQRQPISGPPVPRAGTQASVESTGSAAPWPPDDWEAPGARAG